MLSYWSQTKLFLIQMFWIPPLVVCYSSNCIMYSISSVFNHNKWSFLGICFFVALKQHLLNYYFIFRKNNSAFLSLERRAVPGLCLHLSDERSWYKGILNVKVSFFAPFLHGKDQPADLLHEAPFLSLGIRPIICGQLPRPFCNTPGNK